MTLKSFIKKYKGTKGVGNTPKNKGQCTGLVQLWIANLELKHIWGHAKDIYANASINEYEKIGNAPKAYPTSGDIICWNSVTGGGFGHIAIVVSSDPKKDTVEVFEQNNWTGDNDPSCEITVYSNWRGIIGWLRPHVLDDGENDTPELPEPCLEYKEDIEVLLETKGSLESRLEVSVDKEIKLVQKINKLDEIYASLKKTYAKEIKELSDQRDKCQKNYAELYSSYEISADTSYKMIKELEKRIIELEKPEEVYDMKIKEYWNKLPKSAKVLIYVSISSALSELIIELGGFEQTLLIRSLNGIINIIIVAVEKEIVPAVKARLTKK